MAGRGLCSIAALASLCQGDIGLRRESLDVQWVATSRQAASAALEWVHVDVSDTFVELGCGDGRVALEAAQRGARAVCVERDAVLAAKARQHLTSSGHSDLVEVTEIDLFEANLTDATVIFLFLLPELNSALRPTLASAPRLRAVVSHKFEVYGWPCGERLRTDDTLFLKWERPFAPGADVQAVAPTDEDAFHEALVEHAIECGVEEIDVGAEAHSVT